MKNRFLFGLIIVVAIFFTPWWLVVLLVGAGAFLWSPYYEIIGYGLLFDILYGVMGVPFGGVTGIVTAVVLFYFGSYLKKILR